MYRRHELLVCCILIIAAVSASDTGKTPAGSMTLAVLELRASSAGGRVSHKNIDANFAPKSLSSHPAGWDSRRNAAIAFFRAYDEQYRLTTVNREIAGFLLESDTGSYHFSNGIETPAFFTLRARISGPAGWRVAGFMHTHPVEDSSQEYFSEFDYEGMKSTSRPYYLRTPSGDLRYMDPETIMKIPVGAAGVSHCVDAIPCLAPHPNATHTGQ